MRLFAQGWSDRKDGPGHRRIYYLKGCNLACRWCASPESIAGSDELLFRPERAAGEMLDELCPYGAIKLNQLDRSRCRSCADQFCRKLRHPSLEWCGIDISSEALLAEITELANNWGNFGGVTFGGGEPSLQARELALLLHCLRQRGIHSAIESNAATEFFPLLIPEAALVIADLKSGIPKTFQVNTGGDLELVLANLTRAAQEAEALLIRIPLVPGCNDMPEERSAMRDILKTLNETRRCAKGEVLAVEVLRFHHFGDSKYQALGIPCPLSQVSSSPLEIVKNFEHELAEVGLRIERN